MPRLRTIIAVTGAAAVALAGTTVGLGGTALAGLRPEGAMLAGTAVPFTSHTRATANVTGAQPLTVEVWLKPRLAAAQQFATAVSTPGSASFRDFLSPDAYTARFGPTRAQASAVTMWLRSRGFTDITSGAQRDYVRATAPVSKINTAFGVMMKVYQATQQVNAGPYPLHANDRPVTIPASLAPDVLGVTGLDNAAPLLTSTPTTRVTASKATTLPPCSQYYGQHMASRLPSRFGATSFPTVECGYSAQQIRAAYGASTTSTGTGTGTGQTIAFVALGLAPQMFTALTDFATAGGLPAPVASRYTELDQQPVSCTYDANQFTEALGVEASYDMAPGASQLVVGGDACDNGDFGLQGVFNADTTVINGNGAKPLATICTNAWGSGREGEPAQVTGIEHTYLVKAASVGVGMYFTSGNDFGVGTPSSDPYATAVGGTTLGLGRADRRLFETGWSGGSWSVNHRFWVPNGTNFGAGGGPSLLWGQPAYQQGVVPASMSTPAGDRGPARVVPDISADADPLTAMDVDVLLNGTVQQMDVGGTGLAVPLVAGMVAAAQQGQAKPFGFLNPVFYKLAGTSALHDTLPLTTSSPALWRAQVCGFNVACGPASVGGVVLNQSDDQSQSLPLYNGQVTAKGYDTMTGVGTPNGQAFITALRAMG